MRIKLSVAVGSDIVKEDWLDIPDVKLEEYSVEETEAIIEVHVKKWIDRHVSVTWEAPDEEIEHN